MNFSGFREFLEEMDPNLSKQTGSAPEPEGRSKDYLYTLGDEFGMEWDDIAKALEADPWVSANFQLGDGKFYKASTWKIVPGTLTPNGADIMLVDPGRTYLKGRRLDKSGVKDGNRYHLNRQQLSAFLTKGWTPSMQQPGGF